mmetsp:Transcript_61756/g.116266  ORF Transcript_61756/g.116266 Transcript_61756/m.116266 type:complete len:84 (-) Transcript_61756:1436-1687(-)
MEPAAQTEHELCAGAGWALPTGQLSHATALDPLAWVPAAHATHAAAPLSGAADPGEQSVHWLARDALAAPGAQDVHTADPPAE